MTNAATPSLLQRIGAWFGALPAKAADRLPVRVGGMEYRQTTATPAHVLGFDQALVWVVVALLAWGLGMVYSASIAMPDNPRYGKIAPLHFLVRHVMALVMGFVAALLAFQVSMKTWERVAPWLFVASIMLLILVLIPHVGTAVNGARRWLSLGVMNFQPSELAKFAVLIYAADYMVRKMDVKENFFRAVLPMGAAVAIVGALLLAEPDMGAFMVIAVIAMGILFLGGVNMRMFILIGTVLVSAFALIVMTSPWRRERIFAYLDPFSEAHALGKGYQLSHSLIAFGRGELFGVGLGASVEKLLYLPEAHTDFLLAVIAEELGFAGVALVLALFAWLIYRAWAIGRQAVRLERPFAALAAQGIGVWIGVQAFINIGVNMGVLPTKGLTLPLLSFGGSGIVANLIALGVLLRIDWENRQLMRGYSV